MSHLYDAAVSALAKGPRTTEQIVTECRASGLRCRPETIELFLRLSHEIVEKEGNWSRRRGSKQDRIVDALARAFASGQAYLPIAQLARVLNEGEVITEDDIRSACEASGGYRLKGQFILRV
jgi:hypothetical protein